MTGLLRGVVLLSWLGVAAGVGVLLLGRVEALSARLAARRGGRHRR